MAKQKSDPGSPFGHIQHPKKRAFLAAYAETGNAVKAAELAGIDRTTPYTKQWRGDEEFMAAWEDARPMAAAHLEAEAVRRAVEGVSEPVGWYKGAPGGTVQRYSDTLLIFLLKGAMPDKYAERRQVSGKDGGPIEFEDVTAARDAVLSDLEAIAKRRAAVSTNGKAKTNGRT